MNRDAPPEMVKFMKEIQSAIETLGSPDGKVAMFGNTNLGIFCVVISVQPFPNMMILLGCIQMLLTGMQEEFEKAYQFNAQSSN